MFFFAGQTRYVMVYLAVFFSHLYDKFWRRPALLCFEAAQLGVFYFFETNFSGLSGTVSDIYESDFLVCCSADHCASHETSTDHVAALVWVVELV